MRSFHTSTPFYNLYQPPPSLHMHSLLNKLQDTAAKELSALHTKVKTAVSRDKFRFQDGTFDLDLCYVTTRIIGM